MKPSEKRKNLIKVAKLYYYGNLSQEEIATMLNISRSKVSRMLSQAHQYNIVQITIKDPIFSNEEIAKKISDHFKLKDVIVVSTGQNPEEAKDNIGVAATNYLNNQLFDGIKIGIAWGTTINSFVNRFHSDISLPHSTVVQMVGGTYVPNMHLDGRDLVKTLAQKLKCNPSVLQAPPIVNNPQLKKLLMEENENINHMNLISSLDIAFIGLGSSNYKDCVLYKAKYLTLDEAQTLSANNLIDICGHQVNINGEEPLEALKERHIGISLKQLANIPTVVGLCSGNNKSQSIISAINGKYIDVLIIDEIAAISLLAAVNL